MSQSLILLTTFVSAFILAAAVSTIAFSRREIAVRLEAEEHDEEEEELIEVPQEIRGLPMSEAVLVQHYYNVIRNDNNPNSIANRLIRAGYFHPSAARTFQLIRIVVALSLATLLMVVVPFFLEELPKSSLFMIALFIGALGFMVMNIVLEKMGDKREILYRRLFPDFLDTMIVCVDAGLSVEAAVDKVAKEFLKSSKKDFGLHLAIMMLEVRGGRRLRDALKNFADRLRIDEAVSLAVLFRQSEELGASVTKTLRVFSQEMRDKRMIAAEEKANALPFKMLFPLAAFLFPISILIVAMPVVMKVLKIFESLSN